MLLWKVCVVGGVFDFEGVCVFAFSSHDVGERVEAWVADWDTDGVVSVFLEEFDKYVFAVEASFAPSAKRNSVNFFHAAFPLGYGSSCLKGAGDKKLLYLCEEQVWAMLLYTLFFRCKSLEYNGDM